MLKTNIIWLTENPVFFWKETSFWKCQSGILSFLFALVFWLVIWGSQNKFVKSFMRSEITFSVNKKKIDL